jgi:hypothetical protein
MWTPTTRVQHSRSGLRYGSDVTDAEWLLLSPFLPVPSRCDAPIRRGESDDSGAAYGEAGGFLGGRGCVQRHLDTRINPVKVGEFMIHCAGHDLGSGGWSSGRYSGFRSILSV